MFFITQLWQDGLASSDASKYEDEPIKSLHGLIFIRCIALLGNILLFHTHSAISFQHLSGTCSMTIVFTSGKLRNLQLWYCAWELSLNMSSVSVRNKQVLGPFHSNRVALSSAVSLAPAASSSRNALGELASHPLSKWFLAHQNKLQLKWLFVKRN